MVVLIVTGSMREPPLNCDVRGLERMSPLLRRDEYRKFKRRLSMEADPYPNQSVYINKTAAEVLTVLTDFGFTIAAQSEHSAGNFITWTLVRKEPFLVIRRKILWNLWIVIITVNLCPQMFLRENTCMKPNPAT